MNKTRLKEKNHLCPAYNIFGLGILNILKVHFEWLYYILCVILYRLAAGVKVQKLGTISRRCMAWSERYFRYFSKTHYIYIIVPTYWYKEMYNSIGI